MKPCIKHSMILLTLVACLSWLLAGHVMAQTSTTLHSFTAGSDGALPYAGLILSGNMLYGTTYLGGAPSYAGNVFAIAPDGTGFETLHNFTAPDSHYVNGDGAYPYSG